jgi:LDH2 family malate/lactate/ureidoglycolate dehydrogenase
MPGEPEARSRLRKMRDGIAIDLTTWNQLTATARTLGVPIEPAAP